MLAASRARCCHPVLLTGCVMGFLVRVVACSVLLVRMPLFAALLFMPLPWPTHCCLHAPNPARLLCVPAPASGLFVPRLRCYSPASLLARWLPGCLGFVGAHCSAPHFLFCSVLFICGGDSVPILSCFPEPPLVPLWFSWLLICIISGCFSGPPGLPVAWCLLWVWAWCSLRVPGVALELLCFARAAVLLLIPYSAVSRHGMLAWHLGSLCLPVWHSVLVWV